MSETMKEQIFESLARNKVVYLQGRTSVFFTDGKYTTSDPEEIEAIKKSLKLEKEKATARIKKAKKG
ncbi:MAG: hypothetical protein GY853_09540 [PVC group bacterium]|nr:hypothetical protein [PVC group bacterium]